MKNAKRIGALVPIALLVSACQASTGAATHERGTVSSEDLRNTSEPIEVTLQRKVTGVTLLRTSDGGLAVQIRGGTLSEPNATPLWVLNGVPFHPGPEGQLTGIDPYAIESIRVLKGPQAAIYGIDGANGVIEIKMKSGNRAP